MAGSERGAPLYCSDAGGSLKSKRSKITDQTLDERSKTRDQPTCSRHVEKCEGVEESDQKRTKATSRKRERKRRRRWRAEIYRV